ncbi:LysE family translocator [Leucobacter allii]|uniref:LysE family translocator n=1 Tax=Leucobacter allii TaxID=2932247 RepID=UPI001FD0C96A|nr:LysE family translocator [Leucobacter allii]UOR02457.1 LysE family translocator [Leucobacter allii]
MSMETLVALAFYALVTSITPGPNNLMLLASGVNFGFTRTLPHLAGISIGFGVMVFGVGLGFAELFTAFPALYTVVRVVGALYLVWLAWKIARAPAPSDGGTRGRPLGFFGAAAFQWVNPKAWVMAVGASANYLPAEADIAQVTIVALIYALVNAPSVALWALFGTAARGWLHKPRNRRIFNVLMAILLLATLYPMLTAQLG